MEAKLVAGARHNPLLWLLLVTRGRYQIPLHLRYLGEQLMRLHRGEILRLAVSMPPRHGKTQTILRAFTAWWAGTHPDQRVLLTTYQERLARKWSRQARDDFVTWGPKVWGLEAWRRASPVEWDLFRGDRRTGGGVDAVGRDGAMTGKGCGLFVGDDLVKGLKEVKSATFRQDLYERLQTDAMSRIEPGGRAILVGTRWHYGDPIGRLERAQERGELPGEHWHFLNLAALAEANDPLGRQPGEALWPDRWSQHWLEARRDGGILPQHWLSLYQGRPTAEEGGHFKRPWIRYYVRRGDHIQLPDGRGSVRVRDLTRFVVVDAAATTKTTSDYTVVGAFGFEPSLGVLLLLDLDRGRWSGPDMIPRMRAMQQRWRAGAIYLEKEAHQLHLLQFAAREGLPIRELIADRDKVARALPAMSLMSSGCLLFPSGAGFLGDLEQELLEFNNGDYDDQVDVLSYAVRVFNDLRGTQLWLPDVEPRDRTYDDDVTGRL